MSFGRKKGGARKPWVPRNQNLKGTTPRIFVGNLSYDIDDDAAKKFFEAVGSVNDVHWATDRDSGDFKGFGFLTLGSNDEADKAVAELQGKECMGRPIRIDWAEERKGGGGKGKKGGGRTPDWVTAPTSAKPDGCTQCFLGNLSFDIDEDTVRAHFKDCGEITDCRWVEKDGQFKGVGFITFADSDSTDKAVAKNGQEIMGRAARVDYAQGRKGGKDRLPDWECPECGANCFGSKPTCFKCGAPNPADKNAKRTTVVQKERLPDWDCPECGSTGCFGSKPTCFKCGAENPALKKQAEEKRENNPNRVDFKKKSSKKRKQEEAAATDEAKEVAPESPAKKMKMEDLNPIVYQFLVQAGFKKAAKSFKKEVTFQEDEAAEALLTIYSGYVSSKKRKLEGATDGGSEPKKQKVEDTPAAKEESDSDSDDEEEAAPAAAAAPVKAEADSDSDSDSDDDEPAAAPTPAEPAKEAPKAAEAEDSSDSDSDSDDEEAAAPKAAATPAPAAAADDSSSDSDSDSDEPAKPAAVAKPVTATPGGDDSDSDSDSDSS